MEALGLGKVGCCLKVICKGFCDTVDLREAVSGDARFLGFLCIMQVRESICQRSGLE